MNRTAILRTVALALSAALAPSALALGPPPTPKVARWGGGAWGTANISQKVVNNGDTVTITAALVGGPPKQGYYCAWGNWAVTGTSSIAINIPGGFHVVDYSPKADALHNVFVTSYSVTWSSVIPPSPGHVINAKCYCYDYGGGNESDGATCPENFWKTGMMGPGGTVSVTLKATSSTNTDWNTISTSFSGNWGVGWGDEASDYFKIGGSTTVSLTANPGTLPADGHPSALSAHVYESQSGVNLPNQAVAFSQLPTLGLINPATAVTDANGVAHTTISSVRHGGTTVAASVPPNSQDHVPVIFTPTANSVKNAKNSLGKKNSWSSLGDPVNAGLGNYVFSKQMLAFPGKGLPFGLEVNYNSLDNASSGPLGFGWTHTYNAVLTLPVPPSTVVSVKWGDGHEDTYQGDGAGNFTPTSDCTTDVALTMPDVSHYLATLYNQTTYQFDSGGRLLAITDLNGNQIAITYSSMTPAEIDHITDTAGRQIVFGYDTSGRITSIAPPAGAGNTVAFQYDGPGNLIGITDPRGKTWSFTYDGGHRVLSQINAKGVAVVTNAYDGSGRVVQQTDGAGNTTTYQYTVDAAGTTTKVTPPSGNAVTQVYDLAFNLLSSTDGEGHQAAFATDAMGRLSGATDKNGNAIQASYDAGGNPALAQDRTGALFQLTSNAQNRPTSVTDPLNHTTSFGWDAKGNLTDISNANGEHLGITVDASGLPTAISDFRSSRYQWSYTYDAAGLPQTATDPNGARTGFVHDAAGRPTQISLPSGGTIAATYDAAGNVLTRTDPLSNVTSFTYDDNGDLLTRTLVPTGATTAYAYDWEGRLTKTTDALGGVTGRTYDADGNVVSVTDPDNVTVTFQYDRSNLLTSTTDPLGHRITYGHDANGNVTSRRDDAGNTWSTGYDAEGRPVQLTDPLGHSRTTIYDAAGRVTGVTDPLGNAVTYQYDAAGRPASRTFADQGVVNYVNDQNGRPMYYSDPLGHIWSFYYDGVGHVVQRTDPDGKTDGFGYDGLGRLTQNTLRDGTVINYAYDAGSRLTSVSMPGQTVAYTYDAAGNVTTITDPSGTTTMTYDMLGRRLSRTDPSAKTIAFTYTPAGRVKTMTYPGDNTLTYSYDAGGRLTAISDWKANQTSFQYDTVNRITQATLPNGTKTLFTYDAVGRVAARVHQNSGGTVLASYAYSYDAAGHVASVQRTEPSTPTFLDSSATYVYDPVNRVLTANVDSVIGTYAFDVRGNLITKTSGGVTTSYTYDALNRLASASDGTNTTTYTYDGAGNRLAKRFNGTTTRYVRDGGTIYCTLDGAGSVQSYNVYAGSLLYSLDAAGMIRVYHGDERGSVAAITDASQGVVQSYSYDLYGKVVGATGTVANPFQYVGVHGVMADENGLYQMQARYYDPDARRFITEDPLGLSAGSNLYGYAGGDPVNRTDPTGLREVPWLVPVGNPREDWQWDPTTKIYQGDDVVLTTIEGRVQPRWRPNAYSYDYGGVRYSWETPQQATSYTMEMYAPNYDARWSKELALPQFDPNIEFSSPQCKALVPVEDVPTTPAVWQPHPEAVVDPLQELGGGTIAIDGEKSLSTALVDTGGNVAATSGETLVGTVLETAGATLDIANPILITDAYLSAGPVYDSADGKWKSWHQWQVDHWAAAYKTYDPDFERNLHRILNDPKKRAAFLARLHRKPGPR